MEYLDLSPYEYFPSPLPMYNVGWLGPEHGVQNADLPPLTAEEKTLLDSACRRLANVALGFHRCDFCPPGSRCEGVGEFHFYSRTGVQFAAPSMILHYVEAHGYRPPTMLVDCLRENGGPDWDQRAEYLAGLLYDADDLPEAENFELRSAAVIAIANWADRRALDALLHVAGNQELAGVIGDEIGRSIGMLMEHDFAADVRADDFDEFLRFGMEQIRRPWSR